MLNLLCGKDPTEVGIRTYEGWNITAFIDHVRSCEKCAKSEDKLIRDLNGIIGGGDKD